MRLRFRVDALFGRGIEFSVSCSGMEVTRLPNCRKCPDSRRRTDPTVWRAAGNFGRARRSIASRWRAPTSAQNVLYKDPFPTTVRGVAPRIVVVVYGERQLLPQRRRAQQVAIGR